MILGKKLSCLWTLGLCLVASKSPPKVPSITNQTFIDEAVKAHNEARGRVQPTAASMKHMSWDEGLAKTAKAWANKCKFGHNPCLSKSHQCHPTFQFVGENIWLGALIIFTPKSAVDFWYNETEFYDFNHLSCSKTCGHYTQVVWANSYKVGCAITICPKLGRSDTAIFVCDYGPTGNYPNMPPYTNGTPCSMCEEGDTCIKKLCQNKERDKTRTYPNWNPPGIAPQLIACTPLYLISVFLRLF
ncbi:GLIPR1-like protein 1 [Physeter macrocephalus]|uniref:GLIPR1-like protein 1 n=1 Tax=Physeter macrocephalus TaxID=9755 RepID=A0A2Y9FMA4_PHYMC|nr:GLIPR1-like protein 1 [Physeter catodon]|eukprot:XP_007125871.1 GLIPR1-like protein 1 [Physeter catodon]